jgi:hypothetical protein
MPSGRHHRRWFCTEVTGSSIWHHTTQVNALSRRCRPAPSPASSLAGVTQEHACHMCDQAAALSRGVVALRTQWRHHHGDVASHHQWEHAQHKLAAHAPPIEESRHSAALLARRPLSMPPSSLSLKRPRNTELKWDSGSRRGRRGVLIRRNPRSTVNL